MKPPCTHRSSTPGRHQFLHAGRDRQVTANFTFVDDYYFAEVNSADFKIMTPEPVGRTSSK
ncbi:MAG: hypothetical protein ACLRMJ_11350 [Alistipes finegoldii]